MTSQPTSDPLAEHSPNDDAGPGRAPHRNIVVFSDGTGNSSAKLARTNVWRMYRALDLADPQNYTLPRQFAFYDNGVGTSSFRPLALFGGLFGIGLARNVRELYAFICRTYRPGDKIYAFGFSRGAFTARVLVGLLMNQGIVPYGGNEAELNRLVRAAYRAYRGERFAVRNPLVRGMRRLRDGVIAGWNRLNRRPDYDKARNIGRLGAPDELEVEFVGVWDTVAAYGLPVDELTRAVDQYIWPLSMPDRDLSPRVRRAMHALALDDERHTFHPQLWNEGPPPESSMRLARTSTGPGALQNEPPNGADNQEHIDDERLSQVWFAGAHSDVGGGYADDSVSYVPFEWIRKGAERAGLRFLEPTLEQYRSLSDENGPINDSRRGLASYYRYNPRRIERLIDTDEVKIKRVKIHESVLRRLRVGQDGYAPIVIPPNFQVVKIDGEIVSQTEYLNNPPPPIPRPTLPFDPVAYRSAREHVFNFVWARRVVYFATLAATLFLVAMPLIMPPKADGACQSRLCFVTDILSPLAAVLPGASATWIETFSSRPGIFTGVAAAVVLLVIFGDRLGIKVSDSMRLVWYSASRTKPETQVAFPKPLAAGSVGLWIQKARLSAGYRSAFRFLTHTLLPACFLVVVIYGAIAILSQMVFALRDTMGAFCMSSERLTPVVPRTQPFGFNPDRLCQPTGYSLAEGGTYRIVVAVPANDRWRDWHLPAGPYGTDSNASGAEWQALGVPLRRHLTQAWFKPMARIGSVGSDSYALDPNPSLPREQHQTAAQGAGAAAAGCGCACGAEGSPPTFFTSEIVARTSGELFLYVNDAVFLPGLTGFFYGNNHGSACVTVERVEPAR